MSLNLLAIETSTESCSVALTMDGKTLQKVQQAPREHAYLLLPFVEELLAEAGISLSQLDVLAFGQGPGAFTGLRISAGMTQGLAFGLDLPVIPVSSLAALAVQAQRCFDSSGIVSVFDARMGELYWGRYQVDSANINLSCIEEKLTAPETIFQNNSEPHLYLGPGCVHLADVLAESSASNFKALDEASNYFPLAEDIATLAMPLYQAGETKTMEQALPSYLRNDVAAKAKPKPKAQAQFKVRK